jgi:hypothetical protein
MSGKGRRHIWLFGEAKSHFDLLDSGRKLFNGNPI